MARQVPVLDRTFGVPTNGTNAVLQHLICLADATNGGVKLCTTLKASGFIGVAQEDADTKLEVNVRVAGISRIIAGGSITRGAYVTGDTAGKAVSITPAASGAVTQIVGIALNTAASGELVDVLLQPGLCLT